MVVQLGERQEAKGLAAKQATAVKRKPKAGFILVFFASQETRGDLSCERQGIKQCCRTDPCLETGSRVVILPVWP